MFGNHDYFISRPLSSIKIQYLIFLLSYAIKDSPPNQKLLLEDIYYAIELVCIIKQYIQSWFWHLFLFFSFHTLERPLMDGKWVFKFDLHFLGCWSSILWCQCRRFRRRDVTVLIWVARFYLESLPSFLLSGFVCIILYIIGCLILLVSYRTWRLKVEGLLVSLGNNKI